MKKLLTVLLVVMMSLCCFTGCTKQPDDPTPAGPAALKVGMTGPLSGGAAIYGLAVQRGAQIAAEEVNALGGLQIDFKMEDDQHDPEKAEYAMNSLLGWGMTVSMSSVTTKPAIATSAILVENNIFGLTPSASGVDVVSTNTNVFQMCFTDPNQGSASAQYIANMEGVTKVAVIWQNDIDYSTGIYQSFMAKAKELGLNVVSDTTFVTNATDFTVQIRAAKEAGAELVFLPTYYQENALILAQAKAEDFAPIWFGVDGMDGILTLEGFDTTLAEGVYLLTPWSADSTETKAAAFTAKYNELYGEVPNQFAADAYDCIWAIYQAATAAGVDGNTAAADACAKLVAQFTSMSFDGITGSGATWTASGVVNKAPAAVVIENGVYVGK